MPPAPQSAAPLYLQRVLGDVLTSHGVCRPPPSTPWEKQLEVLEERKRFELQCFLRTATLKLCPYDDALRGTHDEKACAEMARMQALLRGASPTPPPRTVGFDIETEGLDRHENEITVVCLYGHLDPEGHALGSRTFNFLRARQEGTTAVLADEIGAILDRAPRITAFNGSRFDTPFIQTRLGFDAARVGRWMLKTFDLFDIAKAVLRATFKLDYALHINGLKTKSASGMQAVEWAKIPACWPKLEAYCLQDARLTFEISQRSLIKLPTTHPDGGNFHVVQDGPHFRLWVA